MATKTNYATNLVAFATGKTKWMATETRCPSCRKDDVVFQTLPDCRHLRCQSCKYHWKVYRATNAPAN